MRDAKRLKKIMEGLIVVQRDFPEIMPFITEGIGLKLKEALCAYLYKEYKKYSDLVVLAEKGKVACEFEKMIELIDTPGLVPHYEDCSIVIDILGDALEKANQILKAAKSLGCDWVNNLESGK